MKLEIDGELASGQVTTEQLESLDLGKSFNVSSDENNFLQWWVDEDDGSIELYLRTGENDPARYCLVQSDTERTEILQCFRKFISGDNSWTGKFEWEDVPQPGDEGVITEDWALYPRRLEDESIGMIFYNHGVVHALETFAERLLKFKITLKSETENGSPGIEEEEVCSSIEEAIEIFTADNGGIYVGRLTFGQQRDFFCYGDMTQDQVEPFLLEIARESDYEIAATIADDPEHAGYWTDLFPTEQEYQMIADSRIVASLEESEESLLTPRSIQHLAVFETEEGMNQFEQWATAQGFEIEHKFPPDETANDFGIHFKRDDQAELFAIHQVTIAIQDACNESGGMYEGWQNADDAGESVEESAAPENEA